MTYATQWAEADVTYTETTTSTRVGGSLTDTWGYWVVAGTTAAMQASLTTLINTQFANMQSAAAGLSISAGPMRLGPTRAYAVPQTW